LRVQTETVNRDPTGAAEVLADVAAGSSPLAPRHLRRLPALCDGGRQHDLSWIFRMFQAGARGTNGTRIRLPHARGPSGFFSTEAAVMRWLAKLNNTNLSTTARDQGRAHDEATRRLSAAGL
jgi:hypothetical protein